MCSEAWFLILIYCLLFFITNISALHSSDVRPQSTVSLWKEFFHLPGHLVQLHRKGSEAVHLHKGRELNGNGVKKRKCELWTWIFTRRQQGFNRNPLRLISDSPGLPTLLPPPSWPVVARSSTEVGCQRWPPRCLWQGGSSPLALCWKPANRDKLERSIPEVFIITKHLAIFRSPGLRFEVRWHER